MSDRDKILADLSAYLDGELAPQQVRRVEEAAKNDPAVAKELAAIGRTRELVRGLPRVRPGDDFVAAVLEKAERLRLVSAGPERASGGFPVFRWLAAAAVLLVAVGVGVAVAVMLYTAPGPGTGAPGPVARTPAIPPTSIPRGAPPRISSDLEGTLAFEKDSLEGRAGNGEILYAPRDAFETALSDVNGALASNGIEPAGSARQEADGRKQATILVYVDPEQSQQLREALAQVRSRPRASAAEPEAGMKAEAAAPAPQVPSAAAPAAHSPDAVAPLIKGTEPSLRVDRFPGERPQGQFVAGSAGNPTLNTAQQNRAATQPAANLYNSNQSRWNAQPFLITLRSGPAPMAASAVSADAISDRNPGGGTATTAAAATRPASSPATAPTTRSAK